MPTLVTGGIGSGLANSYATVEELQNLALPKPGEAAAIDSMNLTAPFTVNGLTLMTTVSVDGITQPEYTFTFVANYATLDLLIAAIQIPDVIAQNYGGRLRLRTLKVGISQNLVIDHVGTANQKLGFNRFFDTPATGRSTITSDLTEDEMSAALVSASSTADGYLGRRYGLPLVSWSFDLRQAVCYMAAYILLKRQGFNPELYDDNWVNDYYKALTWLDDVGNRRLHPILVDNGHPLVPNASTSQMNDDVRNWGSVIGSRSDWLYC